MWRAVHNWVDSENRQKGKKKGGEAPRRDVFTSGRIFP